MLINVMDYLDAAGTANVQAALDDASDGDRVYLPGIRLNQAPYRSPVGGPWVIRKSIEVFGDGPSDPGASTGTTIEPGGAQDIFLVEVPGAGPGRIESVYCHDFQIRKSAQSDGANGIHVSTAANKTIGAVRLERIRVNELAANGFLFEGTDGTGGAIERVMMVTCGALKCGALGILLKHVLQASIIRCSASSCVVGGTVVDRSGASFYRSSWENNGVGGPGTHPQLRFETAHGASVDAGHFENFQHAPKKACVMTDSGGAAWMAAASFSTPGPNPGEGDVDNTDTVGIEVPEGTVNGPIVIGPNHHTRVDKLVDVARGTIGAVVMAQFVNRNGATEIGRILIPPTEGASGNGVLLASPTISRSGAPGRAFAGLILPSMQADPGWAVQDGMLYYDATNERFRVRINGAWKTVRVA